ncbi:hypothetical protein [Polaribacter atrinae]|uniref:Uncharacterized protein n=1 Tax=Polaribacter atrinae TaxID=1333662 RepID=A0A176TF50_9FLAO|nr:hypothetical protein [Polaribacter atrinae]OAD46173.1 hypothetical protein LPB303_04470 [Polaribacter atrinae]
MKKQIDNSENKIKEITRKEAIKKIGNYGKYTALTALGTYLILNPQKAQASSSSPEAPGTRF